MKLLIINKLEKLKFIYLLKKIVDLIDNYYKKMELEMVFNITLYIMKI